jgi:hypothetical protein
MGDTVLHGSFELKRQTENSDGEMSGEHLGTLLRQVSKTSIGEVDSLIVELKTLHKKLQTDGDRIQRDIAEHAELSQQVMQLTRIISDSVKNLPGRSG